MDPASSLPVEAAELTLAARFPNLAQAYRALRQAVSADVATLSAREQAVVELTWALASGAQNAVNAAVRHALTRGLEPEAILETAKLGLGPLGYSQFLKVFSWVLEALGESPLYCSTCGIPIR